MIRLVKACLRLKAKKLMKIGAPVKIALFRHFIEHANCWRWLQLASTVTAAGVLLARFNLTKNWQKLKTKTNTHHHHGRRPRQ